MRSFRLFGLLFAAFLLLWAIAPAAHAGSWSTQPRTPQVAFDHDDDEGQDADDDADDETGNADDDNELVRVPVYWTAQVAATLSPEAAEQLVRQGSVRTIPGLASPASMASNGLLVIANGPNGQLTIPAPPFDRSMTWGGFGTYDNWATAFMAAHNGNAPSLADEIDFWASQAYAGETGVSPYAAPLSYTTLQPDRPANRINTVE